MKKKLLWISLFVLVIVPATSVAQYKLDLLTYRQLHYSEWPMRIDFYPTQDPFVGEEFDTGTFLTLHVPPCPKSEALLVELYLSATFRETNDPVDLFSASCSCKMVLTSPAIPDDVGNSQESGICAIESVQDGLRPVMPDKTNRREVKFLIPKSGPVWWYMWHKDSGIELSEEEELKILKKLFDTGFDISFSYRGSVKGVQSWMFGIFGAYISGISQK